jgi:hypothetical protein
MGLNDGIRFLRNIYGFDVFVTDFLDEVETAEANLDMYDGVTPPAGAGGAQVGYKLCQFMTLADDDAKPYIGAWRRAPRVESWRDHDIETEYHQLSARFGLNLWRPESLVTVASATGLKLPVQV